MNVYDSDKMADVLCVADGYELTSTAADADLILLNTCSVREKAEDKMFSDLGRIHELKQAKPELLIGVGGCVASQEGAAIIKRAPYVDIVFGPQTLHRLPQMIAARRASLAPQVDISFPEIEKFDQLPLAAVKGVTAFVSVMEGCSKYCSFCVVPYTRGEEISRPLDDVLTEVAELANQGVSEVTLLGQNVNAYRGFMSETESADLALLLEYLAEIPGIARLRFTTSHPKEFTPRLVEAYAKLPKLANHLHLPVQSGSDRVLMAMKRGYTALEYKSIIRRVRAVRPEISLTSDFIVGFPGETEQDFEQTMRLVQELQFDNSYSFLYSRRPGTPAADLTDDTAHEIKQARLQRLQQVIEAQEQEISAHMVGRIWPVLIEGPSRRDAAELMGRTENNRVVNLDAAAGTQLRAGEIVPVRVTRKMHHSLRGELVASNASAALA